MIDFGKTARVVYGVRDIHGMEWNGVGWRGMNCGLDGWGRRGDYEKRKEKKEQTPLYTALPRKGRKVVTLIHGEGKQANKQTNEQDGIQPHNVTHSLTCKGTPPGGMYVW